MTLPDPLPDQMRAWVVREDRHGPPATAMKIETVKTPVPGPDDVVIRVKAAGINFNHIWACEGKPATVSQLHPGDPIHIGGSDASGIVAAIGDNVKRWKVGDEVLTHPNLSCGQCDECNGGEPLACSEQKAWGFETSYGSFAEYARVQAQQLLKKPAHLSWAEASSYALKMFTAYRMLFVRAQLLPGQHVLIWGASGGLGSYAIQLVRMAGAIPVCVTSSTEREDYCRSLGADLFLRRDAYPHLEDLSPSAAPNDGMRQFRRELRKLTGNKDPDIVFEHTGASTFPTSVFVAKKLGTIVTCGATTGHGLSLDARYLWMHQKTVVGSHGCNLHDAARAQALIDQRRIKPTLTKTFPFEEIALAH